MVVRGAVALAVPIGYGFCAASNATTIRHCRLIVDALAVVVAAAALCLGHTIRHVINIITLFTIIIINIIINVSIATVSD